jgi:hypothetical protein
MAKIFKGYLGGMFSAAGPSKPANAPVLGTGNNNIGNINKVFRQPNASAVLSHGMAEYLRPLEGRSKIFSDIREATNELVSRTLDKYKVHVWKSLPSTSGGNFEAFSVGGFSPYLPIDTNWKGWKGGSIYFGVVNNEKAPAQSNPPDANTMAFLLDGGDFYTVNVLFPKSNKFWQNHPNGKGETFGQADYIRIIPPKQGGHTFKVKIIEFKNGLTHLEMAIQEEGQMNRIADTIRAWYEALPSDSYTWKPRTRKPVVEVELYYCPAAATDASFYAGTHVSETVNFITLGALAKILAVDVETLKKYATIRARQNQLITNRLEEIKAKASTYLGALSTNKLNALRKVTPRNLGIANATYTNGYNFSSRKINIIVLMIIRKALIMEYKSQPNEIKKQGIKLKLIDVTSQILTYDKVANNSQSILTAEARTALKTFLMREGGQTSSKIDTAFVQFVHYRREYLNARNLPEWPSEFTTQEMVPRALFTKINQEYKRLFELANRITNSKKLNAEIKAIKNRTGQGAGKRVPTSSAFKSYYAQRMRNLEAKLAKLKENESGENAAPALLRRAISGVPQLNRSALNNAIIKSVINANNFGSAYTSFLKYHTNLAPKLNNKLKALGNGTAKVNLNGEPLNNNAREEYTTRYVTKKSLNSKQR